MGFKSGRLVEAVALYTMCLEVCDMPTINILTIVSISPSRTAHRCGRSGGKGWTYPCHFPSLLR